MRLWVGKHFVRVGRLEVGRTSHTTFWAGWLPLLKARVVCLGFFYVGWVS